jgi:hypothetical protein
MADRINCHPITNTDTDLQDFNNKLLFHISLDSLQTAITI